MNILAIADRAPKQSILEIVRTQPIDIICTLGDLDFFALQELQQITDIPKLGVYGNHCSGNYFDQLGITNMHLNTFEYKGMTFGGFEGSLRYKESKYAIMYTQEEAREMLKDFPHVDIMLAHSPPQDINDEPDSSSHKGLLGLREYIEYKSPKYFLHGHTYPTADTLVKTYLDTNIIYVFEEAILTLD
ncbi:MAG: metallophosphoesterase [Candidatus Magasanikbacteria bacterium]|jgi:uncharacterized protein|nr:metallophosphoesterase [Candidatus Magasanikbacteria bacterium]